MKKLALALLALAFAAPAFAQDSGITLQVNSGNVMTSAGGEFQTATSGQAVVAGQKLMVHADSSATLMYGNACTVKFASPGVYDVPASCQRNAMSMGGTDRKAAAIIIGAGVIGAALINSQDTVPPIGVSAGVR